MVLPKPGQSFDPVAVPKAVKDAGFSIPKVEVVAKGKVERFENFLALRVPGLARTFVLEGGSQIGQLKAKPGVIGAEVTVTGVLHPFHGDKPPGLTVEKFE
ncbi:MAG: hypothetical protein HY652_08705 [Acidobacteria bacterium]|nr:hypothetical protein [Acidobacteriota bacterium]